ncbi:DNA-binding protein RFX6-like [Ixodes scapularis]|uniref:DNA-binding protein RFX6-like n=1 Tax=Ixodes scapularis TaxID=6945 RepID=UPI001C38F968|nr:DNA-binding protein RFX6-like [Ixodes scapularis]
MQRGRRHGWNFWPEPQDLRIPEYIDKDKLDSFLAMYRAHCCSLLDAVIAANFEAVRDLVLHFWTSISESTLAFVSLDVVLDVVTVWDSYLYGVMEEILMPKEIQDIPESYEREINFLVEGLPDWICRITLPGSVQHRRIQVLQEWTKVLKRQLSFTKLAQSCRSVLSNADHTHCILDDLNGLDLDDVATEAFCCLDDSRTTFDIGVAELISLLKKHASVEDLTEWLDMAMDNAALVRSLCSWAGYKQSRSHVYKDFMLSWMLFFSAIMRHLTLSGSPSFGHIHLVRVMAEEYMLLAFETSVARDARLRRQEAVLSLALRPEELRIKMASAWAALSCSNRE